ncbi:MAG: RES family NAD+ phosphorylase [Gemmatimonadaceae bacterium]
MHVWRLIKTKYVASAFDGEGARQFGARWSSRGTRVTYASTSSALAVLEVLVHVARGDGGMPSGYSLIAATVPDELVEELAVGQLPKHWDASPVPPATQAVGDAWVQSGRSLALRVPSAIVRDAHNILVNPSHRDFARFRVISTEPFTFDARLLR